MLNLCFAFYKLDSILTTESCHSFNCVYILRKKTKCY